jgi:hypothetical protein
MTSSNTMPAPPESLSSLLMGNTLAMSKTRNNTNVESNTAKPGGARKLATKIPMISSMTMIPGSFCRKIAAPLVESTIATPVAASKANSAIGGVRAAIRFNPIDGRIATKVPAVPGTKGCTRRRRWTPRKELTCALVQRSATVVLRPTLTPTASVRGQRAWPLMQRGNVKREKTAERRSRSRRVGKLNEIGL